MPRARNIGAIRSSAPLHRKTIRGPLFLDHSVRVYVCIPRAHRPRDTAFAMLLAYSLIPSWVTHNTTTPSFSPSFLSHLLFPSPPFVLAVLPLFPLRPLPDEMLTLSTTSLTCGSFLRPQGPQADSPGRLTELTVSTAGWLGVATQPLDQRATFLLLRVYRRSAGVYLALPASLQPQFTHVTSSNRFAESSRLRSYDFKSLLSNLPPFFLCIRT